MRWFLRRFLSEDERRVIESELAELYEIRRRDAGDRAAGRWLRRQRALYPLHLLVDRLRSSDRADPEGGTLMSGLWRDVMYSLRSLRRSPGLTATIVLTVGLGLGATTSMMTVIQAVVLNPLPYADQDALVWVYSDRPPWQAPLSVADYRTIDEQQTSFSHLAGYQTGTVTVTGGAGAARVTNRNVTWAYFSTLGLQPVAGRLFDKSDDKPGLKLAVLGYEFWKSEFGSDPSVVGRVIPIDGIGHTVVGVVSADRGPIGRGVAVFRPIHWDPPPRKGPFFIRAFARLKPAVTRTMAVEELHAINKRMFPIWQSSYQDANATFGAIQLKERAVGNVTSTLVFVLAAVGCVLLIACTNAVNLLLARAMRRSRELTIRAALGASRRRILQYLAAETLLLTATSAAVGFGVAFASIQLIAAYGGDYIPRIDEIRFGAGALASLTVLSIVSAVVIGLVPAIQSLRLSGGHHVPATDRTVAGGPGARRMRRLLVAAEFALATPLLVAALLVLTSLARLRDVPTGVDSSKILTASVSLPQGAYPNGAAQETFWNRVADRVSALPGVQAVALADSRPPSDVGQENNFDLEDHPAINGNNQPVSGWVGVTPEYFKTLGLTLQEGRLLQTSDFDDNAVTVVVVDRAWANRFFPNDRVLGRRFRQGGCTTCDWTTIVGVVAGTVKYLGLEARDGGTVYWAAGTRQRDRYILLRSDRPSALAAPLRQAIRDLDPNLAVTGVMTVDELVTDSLATPRYLTVLVSTFGTAALLLSLVGIYGVMTYFVQQHRRDIGIRLALGGDASRMRRLVIGQGLAIAAGGIVVGIGVALLGARLMSGVLFGVTATDPLTLAIVPAVLLLTALLACAIPASRAARVQPAEVLRDA